METMFTLASIFLIGVAGVLFGMPGFLITLIACISIQQRLVAIERKRQIEKDVESKFYEMMFKSKKENDNV